jgi:hypothetical protein
MDALTIDRLAQAVGEGSRRAALRTALGGMAWLAEPSGSHAKKRKKKCPACPICPPPSQTPLPFCAAKNDCAQTELRNCHQPGSSPECRCYIRADTSEFFCAKVPFTTGFSCTGCAAGTVCVVLGGFCTHDFGCMEPCPHPL